MFFFLCRRHRLQIGPDVSADTGERSFPHFRTRNSIDFNNSSSFGVWSFLSRCAPPLTVFCTSAALSNRLWKKWDYLNYSTHLSRVCPSSVALYVQFSSARLWFVDFHPEMTKETLVRNIIDNMNSRLDKIFYAIEEKVNVTNLINVNLTLWLLIVDGLDRSWGW